MSVTNHSELVGYTTAANITHTQDGHEYDLHHDAIVGRTYVVEQSTGEVLATLTHDPSGEYILTEPSVTLAEEHDLDAITPPPYHVGSVDIQDAAASFIAGLI